MICLLGTLPGVVALRVPTFQRSSLQTFGRSSAIPFVCHRSEETPAKSNACHTSENPLPQVLCLPHLQDPPGVWSAFCSAPFLSPLATRHSPLATRFFFATPFISYSCALFCTLTKHNSFVFKQFRTLCTKHAGWGYSSHSGSHFSYAGGSTRPEGRFSLPGSRLATRPSTDHGPRITDHGSRLQERRSGVSRAVISRTR